MRETSGILFFPIISWLMVAFIFQGQFKGNGNTTLQSMMNGKHSEQKFESYLTKRRTHQDNSNYIYP